MTTPIPELLAGYVLGDLSPEEQGALELYLSQHPEAQAEIMALEQTLALVPLALPDPSPPLKKPLISLKTLLALVGALGVTIGSIFLGWQSYQMRQQIAQLQQTIQFPDSRVIGLKATNAGDGSMGSLIIAPSQAQGVLVVQNLPQPAPGAKYTLWIVDNRGKKVFCQKFLPDREGRVMVTVPIDRSMVYAPKAVVTIEDAGSRKMVIQGTAL